MNRFDSSLQRLAQTCALCWDQCVSACPVVESTRSTVAYPSRLAAVAWELGRGRLAPDASLALALQQCIACNACTTDCLYLEAPCDVTPVVHWARRVLVEAGQATQAMQALLAHVLADGSPYGNVGPELAALIEASGPRAKAASVVLYADAATLHLAPTMAYSALRLLRALGRPQVAIARQACAGGELWHYGYVEQATAIARSVADDICQLAPEIVLTLSPAVAHLLRHVYPAELGVQIPARVLTLPEFIAREIDANPSRWRPRDDSVYLIVSHAEIHQLHSDAAQRVLECCAASLANPRSDRPHRTMSYPEGIVLDIHPDPRRAILQRLIASIRRSQATQIVVTHACALEALGSAHLPAPLSDLASYVLGTLHNEPS